MTYGEQLRRWMYLLPTLALVMWGCEQPASLDGEDPDSPSPDLSVQVTEIGMDFPDDAVGKTAGSGINGISLAVGDQQGTFSLPVPGHDVSIAFDGTRIFYNAGGSQLHSFEPSDPFGTVISVGVTDGSGNSIDLDAMEYDATRGVIWAAQHGVDNVYQVDPATGDAVFQFSAAGKCARCIGTFRDGLAFDAGNPGDPSDDAIWWSRDVDSEIFKLDLSGNALESFSFGPAIDNRGIDRSSGIAVGGPNLYLGNNGGDQIFRVDKETKTLVDLFAAPGKRPEDMACDPNTFGDTEVMWVRQFEDPGAVFPFEIEPNTCGAGGLPPDAEAPVCELDNMGVDSDGRKYIEVFTQDEGSGLASIDVTKAVNVTVDIPAFSEGATDPVIVRATKVDQDASSQLALEVTDVVGNMTACDPVDVTAGRSRGQPSTYSWDDIPQEWHLVDVQNFDPGLTNIQLRVNGDVYEIAGLKDGESRQLDIAASLHDGDNSVSLTALGKPGGEAWVLIHD